VSGAMDRGLGFDRQGSNPNIATSTSTSTSTNTSTNGGIGGDGNPHRRTSSGGRAQEISSLSSSGDVNPHRRTSSGGRGTGLVSF
jgi:hypothetical protein